jgi:hypothetical protein
MADSTAETVITLVALDVAFTMVTGLTGIHGLIVDVGADFGEAVGIEPWFDAHAGHDHGAVAANDEHFGHDHDATPSKPVTVEWLETREAA